MMKKLLSAIKDYLFVPRCEGCGCRISHTGIGLCSKCFEKYNNELEEYCDFCGMAATVCKCIPKNLKNAGCTDYRKLVFYKKTYGYSPIRSMIYAIKRSHKKTLIEFFAKELGKIETRGGFEDVIVTFAPRTTEALREYGYDQGALLAKYYAKFTGAIYKPLFRRVDRGKNYEQKLMNFSQRAANIRGVFKPKNQKYIYGKSIILIDDVVTSGSTLGECTKLLYDLGAKNVVCRSIAQTYRENKYKKD